MANEDRWLQRLNQSDAAKASDRKCNTAKQSTQQNECPEASPEVDRPRAIPPQLCVSPFGLINNMGDRAPEVTERQFVDLMSGAAGGTDANQFASLCLRKTTRSPRAFEYISAHMSFASAAMNGEDPDARSSPASASGRSPKSTNRIGRRLLSLLNGRRATQYQQSFRKA